MPERIEIRELSSLDDLRAMTRVLDDVWGEKQILSVELLRALTTHGAAVLGAFAGERMVGAQMGFLGRVEGELVLHSHVTGVLPGREHTGVGFALKAAQRTWALEHGIETVTWTFDPLIARNAHFNLRKLGARCERFHRNFYGEMADAINAGERSDRLEVVWRLRHPRAAASAEGRPSVEEASEPRPLLEDRGGRPVASEASGGPFLVHVPPDYLALRERDGELAREWRGAVAEALDRAFAAGCIAVDFRREDSSYLLASP